ncbi:MAG: NADAR family protein [Chloroflexi bacterium]|nr:NADAR family protein [Chloroflexota bacterium]
MRSYEREKSCGFRFTAAAWGELSNFFPLATPIATGPWLFTTSESAYQACKFPGRPDVQQRIAEAPTARQAAAIGRTPGLGIDLGWNAQRVDVMRWVLRMKREANAAEIDGVLAETGERPIVEVSTRDAWWGARPVAARYEGNNVLGRLWMELRQQLRENDPAARSRAWVGRIRVGCLAGGTAVAQAAPPSS